MAKWIAIPHCVTIKAGAMGSVPVVKTWSVANKTVIGIDPNRRQFHFPCWISKTIQEDKTIVLDTLKAMDDKGANVGAKAILK